MNFDLTKEKLENDEGCLRFVVHCQQGNHRRKFADRKHVIDVTERKNGSLKIIFIALSNFYSCLATKSSNEFQGGLKYASGT